MNSTSIWNTPNASNAVHPCVYPVPHDTIEPAESERRYKCDTVLDDIPENPTLNDLKRLPPCLQVDYILSNGDHKDKYPEAPRIPLITDQHHNLEHRWVMKNWMWQLDCYLVELSHSCKFFPSVQELLNEDTDIETASVPIINMEQELSYKLKRVFEFLRLLHMAW